MTARAVAVIADVRVREVVAHVPDGWTVQRLWDELVRAGNDPARMTMRADHVVIAAQEG